MVRPERVLILATSFVVTCAASATAAVVPLDLNSEAGSNPGSFCEVNGKILFAANDGTSGLEPWVTDGTESGTVILKNINPSGDSSPSHFRSLGSYVFFAADDGSRGVQLWRTDGTPDGTELADEINPTGSAEIWGIWEMGGALYISANDGVNGSELFMSDGSVGGAALLKDIRPGPQSSYPLQAEVVGSYLFFSAHDGTTLTELHVTDGTPAGTALVRDIYVGGSGAPESMCSFGGLLLFSARTWDNGWELWRSDGTEPGTELVMDVWPGVFDSFPSRGVPMGGWYYFSASDPTNGRGLWRTQGDVSTTELVAGEIDPSYLTVMGSHVFFSAYDGSNGVELWKTDGTPGNASMVVDLFPGPTGSSPTEVKAIGSVAYMRANDGTVGNEAFRTDGTSSGTVVAADVNQTDDANPERLTAVGSQLFCKATVAAFGVELCASDGTPAGSALAADLRQGSDSSSITYIGALGSTAYVDAWTLAVGSELYGSDGTPGGTALVKDINPYTYVSGDPAHSYPGPMVEHNSLLYFAATVFDPMQPTNSTGAELWKSDGTELGTVLVQDIWPGEPGSGPAEFEAAGSYLYFAASDDTAGRELWRTDAAGTSCTRIDDIVTGMGDSQPMYLAALGTDVFFTAFDGNYYRQVYYTDGSTVSTLTNYAPGMPSVEVGPLVPMGSHVYFATTDGSTGFELYRADTSSSEKVVDISAAVDPHVGGLVAVGSTVYFSADDGTHGRELWKSDGSAAGTAMVADLWPGATGSSPAHLCAHDGLVWFSADDGWHGQELWRSDGTPEGTIMVEDVVAGSAGTSPQRLTVANGILYFVNDTPRHGMDLTSFQQSASVSILDARAIEGDLGTQSITFSVSLWQALGTTETVQYQLVEGTATVADDNLVLVGASVTFAPGDTLETVTVQFDGDTAFEQDESFFVMLATPSGGITILDDRAEGRITNDDMGITVSDASVVEGDAGDSTLGFTVSTTLPAEQVVTVTVETADATATVADGDYESLTSHAVTFNPGDVDHAVDIVVHGDSVYELDETLTLTVTDSAGADLIDGVGTGTILADDGKPIVSVGDTTAAEGDTTDATLTFTVALSNPSSEVVTVDWETQDNTATLADSDYVSTSGTATFPAGTITQTVDVTVIADTTYEGDDVVCVTATASTNALYITGGPGNGAITNDDAFPEISIADASIPEGNAGTTGCAFAVSLSNPSYQTVSVDYDTNDLTAVAGEDYTAASGTLDIAPGDTAGSITVSVNGDEIAEGNDTFTVDLSGEVNGTIADAQAVGEIADDDADEQDSGCAPGASDPGLLVVAVGLLAALARMRDHARQWAA